jgi:Glycosyl hydrolase family 47
VGAAPGTLPRPRDRPDAAAVGGSTRLAWPKLVADVARRDAVVEAAAHAWGGYVAHAWGFDELQPLSESGKNSFGGLGATIVDSLDTLLMLNLTDAAAAAREWIVKKMRLDVDFDASVFETTIRVWADGYSQYPPLFAGV